MEVWGFMEMIHSRSYTYIIKNVYSDPSEVFDKIVSDERILERASSVTEAYDDFIRSAHQWDTGKMWSDDFRGSPTAEWEIKDVKRKLYRAMANVNILEGIRFYVSFACELSHLVNLNLWKGPLRLSHLSPEMKTSTLQLLKTSSISGGQVMIQK